MRVLVTGASGNVGTALLRALSADPAVEEIVGLARREPARLPAKTRWACADVAQDDLSPHFAGVDVVVHLAWLIQPSHDESVTEAVNVRGSERVVRAALDSGVRSIVHASSVGAYAPGPKDRFVDESWPATGIPASFYSRHKAAVERHLDTLEDAHPALRIVRMRPGLTFQRSAASEIQRLFAGPLLPRRLLRPGLIPIVPEHPRLRTQAVHTDDVADAYRRAVLSDARGAFNVAADPPLDGEVLAQLLGARTVRVSPRVLRAGARLSWRLRLQPSPPGWLDLAAGTPLMSTQRARTELGWTPRHSAVDALVELLEGLRAGADGPTPPLQRSVRTRIAAPRGG